MNLFRLSVDRPIATSMVFIAIMVFGIYSYLRLPVDLFPDIESPILSVVTTYPGAGALEVEQNITDNLESVLGTVPNLKQMRSTSLDNFSVVTLEFEWGIGMDEASNDVRDRLGRASRLLPEDADEPIIQKFDAGAIPVIIYSATATTSFGELEQIIDDQIAGPLNRISGVGDVSITGAPEQQIQVILDPARMQAYNLDIQRLSQAIQAENISSPLGRVDLAQESYNLRVNAEFRTIEEIGNIIVGRSPIGGEIRLHQVAAVQEGIADESAISRVNGRQGLTFSVQKQSDANTVRVAGAVRDAMPALLVGLPDDVEVQLVIDTSEFVLSSVDNLSSVLFYALLFVVLVVLIFLKQWRATIIVAATIPVSLIVAFIYLAITGSTLNIISLSSLAIALGMVVDDAIVVLENIMTHIEKGSRPKEAAIYGTREVGVAVIATTLTVVAVFLPLTFLTGVAGIWFKQLGYIVVVTVVTSTVAALTLIPMMSSLMLRKQDSERKRSFMTRILSNSIEKILVSIEEIYGDIMRMALRFKKSVVVLALMIFASSLLLIPHIGMEFMPVSDNSNIQISGELDTSRSLEFTSDVVQRIEKSFTDSVPELVLLNSTTGFASAFGGGGSGGNNEFQIRMEVTKPDKRERSIFEIADQLRAILDDVPEVVSYTASAGSGAQGGARPIEIHILGHDLDQTSALAAELSELMSGITGVRDVELSRGASRPEFELVFDRDKLSRYSLNAASVAAAVRGNVGGQTATVFRRAGQEYDVVLRYDEQSRDALALLENMTVMNPLGHQINVRDLGVFREFQAPPNIEHHDRERVITVSAGIQDRALSQIMDDINGWINQQVLPPQIEIVVAGDAEEQREAFIDLFMVLVLSILLVYLVMAAQLESLKDPFVIMFSVPFAFTGVFLALILTKTNLSVIGFVGAIILVGIVVKNAIVLVDYIKLLQNREYPITEAIVQGGVSRLRPVLMTTLTTVLAMLPLAFGIGEGSETWQPMAISVIGGLIFSTIVTLVLIPVIYGLFERKAFLKEQNAS